MTWYTTTVDAPEKLQGKLQELEDAGHTIVQVIALSGKAVIISKI